MEAKNNPQSASVIKCVTPGCHSLPLTGRHTHSRHNAVTQPFFHFSLTALLGRGEHSSRRAGGHAGKKKAAFIADANINSTQSQRVDRGAACPSIASVCVLHHRKKRRGRSWQSGSQAGWCLLDTLTRRRSLHLWKSISVRERSSAVTACLDVFLEFRLYSCSQVMLG